MRQGCSSLLTLISSGFVLAPHPVVSVVTLMFGLPDVARAETGLGLVWWWVRVRVRVH